MKKIKNKKITSLVLICLIISMSTAALVKAEPLDDKNNNKFQTYSVTAIFGFNAAIQRSEFNWIPSQTNTNVMILEHDEQFMQYDITIDDHTYKLGTDFVYTGHAKYVFFEPVFGIYGPYYPVSYRSQYHVADFMFDFSAIPGGIEGTLNMRAKFSSQGGEMDINSLAGTGDLQNVQIKATHAGASITKGVTTAAHAGYVLGWPE